MWIILKFSNKRFDDFHLMFLILVFLLDMCAKKTVNSALIIAQIIEFIVPMVYLFSIC